MYLTMQIIYLDIDLKCETLQTHYTLMINKMCNGSRTT